MKTAIQYVHRVHPRARRMTLKVSETGEVVVVTPRFTPKWSITLFVSTHLEWITKQLAEVKKTAETRDTSSIQLFGKSYHLTVDYTGMHPAGVRIEEQTVYVAPTTMQTDKSWTDSNQEQLEKFLKRTARAYIEPRTQQLAQKMVITYGQVRYKQQKSRWGSCSSDGNLNFNWRLVHCPPDIIDYVIIHELAHRKHMDHSQRFWNLVAQYDPEHRAHRGWLKRHGRYFV